MIFTALTSWSSRCGAERLLWRSGRWLRGDIAGNAYLSLGDKQESLIVLKYPESCGQTFQDWNCWLIFCGTSSYVT